MKNLFTILFSLLISIYSIGCDSSNSSTNSSNCPINQSIGCDSNCAENPLQNDTCGVCGGNGSTCEGLWNVFYEVSIPFAGFQFNIDGASGISASGGAAEAAGFMISASSTTVIGFSLSGSTIPLGAGTLISLEIIGDSDSFCISDLILSDVDGNKIDDPTIEDCNTIKYSD